MISIVKTLNLFTRERAIVGRERTKGLYDTSAYVLSKVLDIYICILYYIYNTQLVGRSMRSRFFIWG